MAPEEGLEPSTTRLTAACSTIELLWNPICKGANSTNHLSQRQFIFHQIWEWQQHDDECPSGPRTEKCSVG